MIGDWVRFKHSDLVHQIKAISRVSLKVDNGNWYRAKVFDPIPITEEILEANGFDKRLHDRTTLVVWKPRNNDFSLVKYNYHRATVSISVSPFRRVAPHNEAEQTIDAIGCMFVHQLQHALRLCGVDKEIIL